MEHHQLLEVAVGDAIDPIPGNTGRVGHATRFTNGIGGAALIEEAFPERGIQALARVAAKLAALVACAASIVMALLPATALGHGGSQVFLGNVGSYYIDARRVVTNTAKGDLVDYTVTLRDKEHHQPVTGATVTITVKQPPEAAGIYEAPGGSYQYEALIPKKGGDSWHVAVNIDGPLGKASYENSFNVGGVGLPLEWIALAVGLLVLAGLARWHKRITVWVKGGRAPHPSSPA
ncbi:MAG: hypothetical protein HY261_06645 [Chloroflexi bacterium]|nr:hypothetical protein [Chloroflexota bacterium]